MNDIKVFKLGVGNYLGISYMWYSLGVQRLKVKVREQYGQQYGAGSNSMSAF